MADWGNSFLQALGWATLNNIWQMALLWLLYLLITHSTSLPSYKKYLIAIGGAFLGFAWYLITFTVYFFSKPNSDFSFLADHSSSNLLPPILQAASVTYLLLLALPVYRIFRNWRFLQFIKKQGLEKAPLPQRLFAQKISVQLGIKKQVKVYLSRFVSSPLTIGFIKPMILLPFTTVNHLTTEQMEAVLLHELSHIRRYDYLVNLVLAFIQVILYYNPFLKAFLKQAELERENCCDELVLQFQYDKIAYAHALVELEKKASCVRLAMAAANQNYLLQRIEKIVGMPRKRKFEAVHFLGALTGLLMLLAIQSLVFDRGKQKFSADVASDYFSQPSTLFFYSDAENASTPMVAKVKKKSTEQLAKTKKINSENLGTTVPFIAIESSKNFITVAYNETTAAQEAAKKEQVQKTVETTKKVLQAKWKEVEASIADGMSQEEKEEAKIAYMNEIDAINWSRVEQGLQSKYDNLDWATINSNLSEELVVARLDSMETEYKQMLSELNQADNCKSQSNLLLPDVSVQQIAKAKAAIKAQIERIRVVRSKRIVHL